MKNVKTDVKKEVSTLVEETLKQDNIVKDEVAIDVVEKTVKVNKKSLKQDVVENVETFIKEDKIIKYNFEEKNLIVNNVKQVIKSKSDMFRIMYNEGMEVCEIAKLSKSHYSFVYEVISKSNGQVRNVVKESKSDEFRKLFDDGLTVGQIAKQTNSNYSFVHTCIKKYKELKEVK